MQLASVNDTDCLAFTAGDGFRGNKVYLRTDAEHGRNCGCKAALLVLYILQRWNKELLEGVYVLAVVAVRKVIVRGNHHVKAVVLLFLQVEVQGVAGRLGYALPELWKGAVTFRHITGRNRDENISVFHLAGEPEETVLIGCGYFISVRHHHSGQPFSAIQNCTFDGGALLVRNVRSGTSGPEGVLLSGLVQETMARKQMTTARSMRIRWVL